MTLIPFYLKKWYSDLITDDGAAIYVHFVAARIAGLGSGYISAHVTSADHKSICSSTARRVRLSASDNGARCGRNFLINESNASQVHVELPELGVDLRYRSTCSAWTPQEDGVLLRQKGQYLSWTVPLPAAAVEGVIRHGKQQRPVRGRGYQDIVEMTLPPWRLPLAELNWGRAHCGDHTVVFDSVRTADGRCLQFAMLQSPDSESPRIESGAFTIEADPGDEKTVLRHDGFKLMLSRKHVIQEGRIGSRRHARTGLLGSLLARFSGDPCEKKMMSAAELCLGGRTYTGWAIHEIVKWDWD